LRGFVVLFDELEERHLRDLQAEFGSYVGDVLRREIKASLMTRIELATTNARELVRVLNEQAPLGPVTVPSVLPAAPSLHALKTTPGDERRARSKAPRKRTAPAGKGRTYTGTVLSINPHGATVSLDSGEQGWLHVSHVRRLNGGAWVESVFDVLKVGQKLRVRGIGTTDRGQVGLALVDARASKPAGSNTTAAAPEPSDDVPPTAAESRRGGRKWFGFGRNKKDRT
jgi:predicted RNA-binding protein with RPS1 domain